MYPGMRQIFLNWKEEEKKYLQILNCKKLSEHVGFKKIIFGLIFASYWTWKKMKNFCKIWQGPTRDGSIGGSSSWGGSVTGSTFRHTAVYSKSYCFLSQIYIYWYTVCTVYEYERLTKRLIFHNALQYCIVLFSSLRFKQ